jgi:hypothetical protein
MAGEQSSATSWTPTVTHQARQGRDAPIEALIAATDSRSRVKGSIPPWHAGRPRKRRITAAGLNCGERDEKGTRARAGYQSRC